MSYRPEFDFIRQLSSIHQPIHPLVKLGMGDDAAILSGIDKDKELLITTDALMDGVDFIIAECGYYLAGRKSLAVNLSDLAAMAALPVAGFVSLILPKSITSGELAELMRGIMELAGEFNLTIAGGDTNSWEGKLVISITLVGQCDQGKAVIRSGAKAGDLIVVSGQLGGSIQGHHLNFSPRVKLAQQLNQDLNLTSMIDLSDGLSGDLEHILNASKVGAIVELESLPVSEAAKHMPGPQTSVEHALHDGEDFELLFTIPFNEKSKLSEINLEIPLTVIGQITTTQEYLIRDGNQQLHPMPVTSWSHLYGI